MRINQKGAIDLTLVATLLIVVAVGAFVLVRISGESKTNDQASSQAEAELPPNTFIDAQGNEQTVADYQDCLDWAFPTEMRDDMTYCVGPDGIEFAKPSVENTSDVRSEVEDLSKLTEFTNEEFGFSLAFDEATDLTLQIVDYTNSEDSPVVGKRLQLSNDPYDFFIVAKSTDFSSPKPQYLTDLVSSGYEDSILDEVSTTAMVASSGDEGIYFVQKQELLESRIGVEPEVRTDYVYAFNTRAGGLTIFTQDESQLELIKQIAESVVILE